jgi:hypothetical protein
MPLFIRLPFLVVSIPAMICALLVWLLVEEVDRGEAEKHLDESQSSLEMKELGLGSSQRSDDTYPDEDEFKLQTEVSHDEEVANKLSTGSGTYINLNNQISTPLEDFSLDGGNYNYGRRLRYASTFHSRYLQPHLSTLRILFQCPSVCLAIFQGAPGCIPWGIINVYLNDYLSSDRGMTVEVCFDVLIVPLILQTFIS